ncbi:MAG: DUF4349 domain-containing protein [Gemmatimonadales bacterium]
MWNRSAIGSLLVAGLLACQTRAAGDPATLDKKVTDAVERLEVPATGEAASLMRSTPASQPANAPAPQAAAFTTVGGDPSALAMIIRNGNASVEVDSLEPALAELRRMAQRLGGFVANTSIQSGREQLRQATVELKVPAQRFDDLTAGLQPLGRIEWVNVTAQGVGEEFVDLTARVANGRRLEDRLVTLLATRTGKLQDVLSVERELARVREEIDRQEGRLRWLRERVALSTLSVTLHEPAPVVGDHPGSNPIGEAFRQAWRNFVGLVAGVIGAMGFVLPVAAIGWGTVLLVRRIRR